MSIITRLSHFPFFLLRDVHSSSLSLMANRETDRPLLLSAMLASKDEPEVAMMRPFFSLTPILI